MQSSPLHRLLQSPDAEVLLLPDLEARTVRRLLHFLYLGLLRIGKDDIGEFLGLVEEWGISPRVTIMPSTAEERLLQVEIGLSAFETIKCFVQFKKIRIWESRNLCG